MTMKKVLWTVVLSMFFLVGGVSAYYITFDCPDTVSAGDLFTVTGNSTVKPGFSTSLVFSLMEGQKQEITRQTITIQDEGLFSARFNTNGLRAGRYMVEIVDPTKDTFGGSSKTWQWVILIDRNSEISITSPEFQEFTGLLSVEGAVPGLGNKGVKIEVAGPAGIVFGPTYIATDESGGFSQQIPIDRGGYYQVSFFDADGYIGVRGYTVASPSGTGAQTPSPTTTALPTLLPAISASAQSSRESPAYFTIYPGTGDVQIFTSTGIDWVVEYSAGGGAIEKVNDKGIMSAEEFTLSSSGVPVYFKVYPFSYSDSGTVVLHARNADMIEVGGDAPVHFGAATTPAESPFPLAGAIASFGVGYFLMARRFGR